MGEPTPTAPEENATDRDVVAEPSAIPLSQADPTIPSATNVPPLSIETPPLKKRNLEGGDLEGLQLADIEISDQSMMQNGKEITGKVAVAIKTFPVKLVSLKCLRKVCSLLKTSGYKNMTKDEVLMLIGKHKHNMEVYGNVYNREECGSQSTTRRKTGCSFRLLNVLFSDMFSQRLINLSSTRSRQELDARESVDSKFWKDVREAFIDDSDSETGRLQFEHAVFDLHEIDPSTIVMHTASKLRNMYADLKSRHKKAMANFTKSGTHNSDFWDFCSGQIDILYLHLFVRSKPGMTESITAMMPADARLDSDSVEQLVTCESIPPTPSSTEKRGSRTNEKARKFVAMLDSNGLRSEVAKTKLEEFRSVREYRDKKMKRDEERREEEKQKSLREQRAFYLKQYSEIMSDLRSLLEKRASETNVDIKALIEEELELKQRERMRIKHFLKDQE
jgi:hypothetical protein